MTESAVDPDVVGWLMQGDPSVRWQVQRDLLGESESVWRAERRRVETEGLGAALLAAQGADGLWAGAPFLPQGFTSAQWEAEGQPFTATGFVLSELLDLGLDPASERARRVAVQVDAARWDYNGLPFWQGEVDDCINARLIADGVHFGVDVTPVVERELDNRRADGGWNCYAVEHGARVASFASTLSVLEGLLAWERGLGRESGVAGLTERSREARATGEEWLLDRSLFRRRSTGEVADPDFLRLTDPPRWHYDVLRALDHLRDAGRVPDPRMAEAVDVVRGKHRPDGRWSLDRRLPGRSWVAYDDGEGEPSRRLTLRAMRVLRWWDAG